MKRTNLLIVTALLIVGAGCAAAPKKLEAPQMESMPMAQNAPLEKNHFKSDRMGNLTEDQLRQILESPVFLEDDTRLGIVPVATAYEVDTDLPVETVPSALSMALEDTGHFEVTTEISTDWPKARSVAGLRELAARYRAKYLLLYRHRFVDRTRKNAWGWTYPTVVGLFAAPGTTYEVAGVMEATLFDPRTGTILFTAFERVHDQTTHNVWNVRHKRADLKRKLLTDATQKLADDVTHKVGRLVAARPDQRDVRVSRR